MSGEAHDPQLSGLEALLAGLAPLPGRLDRDQLLFRAGQASMTRTSWLLPGATTLLALLALGLGVALVWRPSPSAVERVVYVPVQPPAPAAISVPELPAPVDVKPARVQGKDHLAQADYLRLRDQVLRLGVDALPPPPAATAAPPMDKADSLLDQIRNRERPRLFRWN